MYFSVDSATVARGVSDATFAPAPAVRMKRSVGSPTVDMRCCAGVIADIGIGVGVGDELNGAPGIDGGGVAPRGGISDPSGSRTGALAAGGPSNDAAARVIADASPLWPSAAG